MRARKEESFQLKKEQLMEGCFAAFARGGLSGTGVKALARECDCSTATFYIYFENLDDLIAQSTAHCMGKIEAEFMARAPRSMDGLEAFIDETPHWAAREHGEEFRLMYQVYSHPKYRESGREFFDGATERYRAYAEELAGSLGLPADALTPIIFTFALTCTHYALFEDEPYLKSQLAVLKQGLELFMSEAKAA